MKMLELKSEDKSALAKIKLSEEYPFLKKVLVHLCSGNTDRLLTKIYDANSEKDILILKAKADAEALILNSFFEILDTATASAVDKT